MFGQLGKSASALPWHSPTAKRISLAVATIVVASGLWVPGFSAGPGKVQAPSKDTSRYGFESGTMKWRAEKFRDTRAVSAVAQSSERARLGQHSLKLTFSLVGEHENLSKGEAVVEIPVQNLRGRRITARVWVPREAIGEMRRPNGIQLFVKDKDWNSEYSTWTNLDPDNTSCWTQVSFPPSTTEPEMGYKDEGFDPTHIRAVGIKIGAGGGSSAKFKGSVYVDAVDW